MDLISVIVQLMLNNKVHMEDTDEANDGYAFYLKEISIEYHAKK